jgi:hypothetical protein
MELQRGICPPHQGRPLSFSTLARVDGIATCQRVHDPSGHCGFSTLARVDGIATQIAYPSRGRRWRFSTLARVDGIATVPRWQDWRHISSFSTLARVDGIATKTYASSKLAEEMLFQYPSTGRWNCNAGSGGDDTERSVFQYPSTGRWNCNSHLWRTGKIKGFPRFQYPSTGRWNCNRRCVEPEGWVQMTLLRLFDALQVSCAFGISHISRRSVSQCGPSSQVCFCTKMPPICENVFGL